MKDQKYNRKLFQCPLCESDITVVSGEWWACSNCDYKGPGWRKHEKFFSRTELIEAVEILFAVAVESECKFVTEGDRTECVAHGWFQNDSGGEFACPSAAANEFLKKMGVK